MLDAFLQFLRSSETTIQIYHSCYNINIYIYIMYMNKNSYWVYKCHLFIIRISWSTTPKPRTQKTAGKTSPQPWTPTHSWDPLTPFIHLWAGGGWWNSTAELGQTEISRHTIASAIDRGRGLGKFHRPIWQGRHFAPGKNMEKCWGQVQPLIFRAFADSCCWCFKEGIPIGRVSLSFFLVSHWKPSNKNGDFLSANEDSAKTWHSPLYYIVG